jgi:hypothetical protein
MTGPDTDYGPNLFTWFGLSILPITYIYANGELLWETNHALYISSIVLGVSTLFFLLLTQFSDPGIIPRKNIFEIINCTWETETCWIMCETCNIKKPPGASHCKLCDNCV